MSLWWLSFCDSDRPAGDQFLGVAIVDADGPTMMHATIAAHARGCNPGGEVLGHFVPPEIAVLVPERMRNRLLTRAEAMAWDEELRRLRLARGEREPLP